MVGNSPIWRVGWPDVRLHAGHVVGCFAVCYAVVWKLSILRGIMKLLWQSLQTAAHILVGCIILVHYALPWILLGIVAALLVP